MLDANTQLKNARAELTRSYDLSDYEAVDVAWVAIVKVANLMPGDSEHKRLLALLEIMPEVEVCKVLSHDAVDNLLNLEPPLETILSDRHERLNVERTVNEINAVRKHRLSQPKIALQNLTEILKRIRNRRAHGFKTPYAPRDAEILGAAAKILRAVGEVSINARAPNPSFKRNA